MKSNENFLEQWLAGLNHDLEETPQDVWDPGFEGERRVVISKLGPYSSLFKRPDKFVKRFFHHVYSLPVSDWQVKDKTPLYGGFCTIESIIDIHFQPTIKYVEANRDVLPDINAHIKTSYESLIRDAINRELLTLDDGNWIHSGLGAIEKQIAQTVNETLMIQNIQCRAICALKPEFQEIREDSILDGQFTQERIYLNVMQKNHSFREKQKQEQYHQEEELEKQRLQHNRALLDQLNEEDEIERKKQLQKAENEKLLQQEKEKLQLEQFEIEQHLHEDKLKHQNRLKEMEREAQAQDQEQQMDLEQQTQADKLVHEKSLKARKLDAEIDEFFKQQTEWNQAKEHLQEEKLQREEHLKQQELEAEIKLQERMQLEQHKMKERLQQEKLQHEQRLKAMELDAEIEEHEKRFASTQKTDEYLRREIELLVLEKRRAELNREIRNAEDIPQNDDGFLYLEND